MFEKGVECMRVENAWEWRGLYRDDTQMQRKLKHAGLGVFRKDLARQELSGGVKFTPRM